MNFKNIYKFIIIISLIGSISTFIVVLPLIRNNNKSTFSIFEKKGLKDEVSGDKNLSKEIIKENYINNKKQCIISSKNKKSFCNNNISVFLDDEYFKNKQLITISPGGFKGFYLLGILTYIKQNYNTDNYIYSGASAGAWNGLFMCYKGEPLSFIYNLLDRNILKAKSITELQYLLKYKLLFNYKEDDFDLKKLFIGVTTFKNIIPNINIYSDFEDFEDVINCCMASSHIPLITGGLTNKYKNMFSLDGGFSNYPYLQKDRLLHIEPFMWENKIISNEKPNFLSNNNNVKRKIKTFKKYSEIFSISKNNILELFDNGYQDAKNHKEYFNNILNNSTTYNENIKQQDNEQEQLHSYDNEIIEF
jgi:hypothetical protein